MELQSVFENSFSRKEEVILFRLRTGHARLNYHLHSIGCHPDGQCEECDCNETVEHFLIECEQYENQRHHFITIANERGHDWTMNNILLNPDIIPYVVDFVRATGRLI